MKLKAFSSYCFSNEQTINIPPFFGIKPNDYEEEIDDRGEEDGKSTVDLHAVPISVIPICRLTPLIGFVRSNAPSILQLFMHLSILLRD